MSAPGGVNLAVWSGPRNISTALMRSWDMRPDCRVVDEPLYAHYLAVTGVDHPGREEVIASGETSWERVVAELVSPVEGVYYQKHMAHHLVPQLPRDWIASLTNIILIRDPAEVVTSYRRTRTTVVEADIGLIQLAELDEQLGHPPVIDAADFLQSPEAYLRWACDHVGVEFLDDMLHWPPGPRPSEGVWAPYWYQGLWASTGFDPYRRREISLDDDARAVTERCRPLYEKLYARRIVIR